MSVGRRIASITEGVTLRWLGVSGFEITHAGRTLLIDPFVARSRAARPPAGVEPGPPRHADAILVSHGHWDHFADVPGIAHRLGSTVYLPADLHREQALRARLLGRQDDSRWRSWEDNRRVDLAGLIVEAYPVHREERRGRWLERAVALALRGRLTPRALLAALQLTLVRPFSSPVGLHLTHAATGASLFFLGSLTRQIYRLPEQPLTADVLALPLTDHSDWWLDDATGLVSLLRPRVVVVHHHDDWCPPLTRPADVGAFRRTVEERCGVPVFEPVLGRPFTLEELLATAKRTSQRPAAPGTRGASPAPRRGGGPSRPGPRGSRGRRGRCRPSP